MYELHPPHLINVATLPCESRNSENVILQRDITKKNCIKCIVYSSSNTPPDTVPFGDVPCWRRAYRLARPLPVRQGLTRDGEWAWLLISTLDHGAVCTAFVRDHYRVYRSYTRPLRCRRPAARHSFKTPKVPCDCL